MSAKAIPANQLTNSRSGPLVEERSREIRFQPVASPTEQVRHREPEQVGSPGSEGCDSGIQQFTASQNRTQVRTASGVHPVSPLCRPASSADGAAGSRLDTIQFSTRFGFQHTACALAPLNSMPRKPMIFESNIYTCVSFCGNQETGAEKSEHLQFFQDPTRRHCV
jgi:hypothetical protein